jgi:hypothetical protein
MNAIEKMVQAARDVLAEAGDDATRPGQGMGRGTGRGMGQGQGRGQGRGRGMGRGRFCGQGGGQGQGLRARDGSCRQTASPAGRGAVAPATPDADA